MPTQKEQEQRMREMLDNLADVLILCLLERDETLIEGEVMTIGPPPYRRIDADGRALCYIRSRPRKGFLRIDISGLWLFKDPCPNQVQTSSGVAVLVRGSAELEVVIDSLIKCVRRTRELENVDQEFEGGGAA